VENSVSVVLPAHSAVMSRPGLYFVEDKTARE